LYVHFEQLGLGAELIAKNKFIAVLAWLQLLVSLAFASVIVWGYITYQASLGQFAHSAAASIGAISNVVGGTATTVEARRGLVDQTGKILLATRSLVNELRVAAENQGKSAPQYAEGLRAASAVTSKLSGTLKAIGDGMLFAVPISIRMDGIKPVVNTSRPLEKQAQELKIQAQDLNAISESLLSISVAIGRDGKNLSSAFIATSEQALKLAEEAERTLVRLNKQDLPIAMENLRATSANLRNIGEQVEMVGSIGKVLLVVGLLLAGWCFLNSLGMLLLANSQTARSTTKAT
jgi:hypothetical protein